MEKRRIIIIILLVIGVLGFTVMDFIIRPRQEKQEIKYKLEQRDAITHDFKNVLQYKNKYMGNMGNICNLNYELPLCNINRTNELNSDERLEYIINYKQTVLGIGKDKIKADLIYNAVANFALIDNLKAITFNFMGSSYKITRSHVQNWYGIELNSLTDETKWKNEVQGKLSDKKYVNEFWKVNFKENINK
ncbi:DUF4825 domain-containing protein [Clostridium sp. FP1]|uniref:DUF4825 domain-containing protein n=1 Tax=Clostridium sp. FP1 TaxID=2724076 RepID=UPI0013E92C49|nr:DUF4825 domain-containing protein [Clostridium sp. FP1]MBZ9633935.1 DUF4825 domain-containing protein [Clostridium sp. FP1]